MCVVNPTCAQFVHVRQSRIPYICVPVRTYASIRAVHARVHPHACVYKCGVVLSSLKNLLLSSNFSNDLYTAGTGFLRVKTSASVDQEK